MQIRTLAKPNNWIALFILLAIAGCGGKKAVSPADVEQQAFDDLREKVGQVIEDPERKALVNAQVDELQRSYTDFMLAVTARRTEVRALNADYDATREQFHEYVEKYNNQILTDHGVLLKSHQALISATTPEEWADLQKADTKMMKKLISSLQAI